jgi:hypothetical protein
VLAGLLLTAGCQRGPETLTPVKGKVTYRGAPLPAGTIVFVPDGSRGTHGNLALADIQPDGTFVMRTNNVAGAVPGHHRVTIAYVQAAGATLPVKYRDPLQSGLVCDVKADKNNVIDFDLE